MKIRDWADSCSDFLSFRFQLLANAELLGGSSCQSLMLANFPHKQYATEQGRGLTGKKELILVVFSLNSVRDLARIV